MIDIKNLRDNIDATSEALLRRGYKLDAEKFKSLDSERKALQVNVETLQSSRKKLSAVSYTHLTLPTIYSV